jgi:hypothetical protein
MPDSAAILELAQTVVREIDHYGRGAPFLAYVKTISEDQLEHVFITREPVLAEKDSSDGKVVYVRYRLPLGRIAETPPGQIATVRVAECIGLQLTGNHHETSYQILARDRFSLRLNDGITDATENELVFPDGAHYLPTLRQWISCTQEEIALEAAKPRRRRTAERLELADTPVVDLHQGEVWRSNIRRFVVISGSPGTGKTTTAIKRIAQKTDATALAEEVSDIPEDRLRQWLSGVQGWVLFTPSELLRSYLHQALGDEKLASTEAHVPLWQDTKRRIGRDVLRLFGKDRQFTLVADGQELVADKDSKSLSDWTVGFREHFAKRIHAELHRITTEQFELIENTLRVSNSSIAEIRLEVEPLQSQMRELDDQLRQSESEQARDVARRKLTEVELRLAPLLERLNTLESANRFWSELVSLGNAAPGMTLGLTLRGLLSVKAKLEQFVDRLGELKFTEAAPAHTKTLVGAARLVLDAFLDESTESLDAVLRKLPIVYQDYRLRASEGGHFYRGDALGEVSNRRLDSLEIDTLIYVALLLVREVFGTQLPQNTGSGITRRLAGEFRYVVAVDEATDFSAVELACMRLLAHPVFDCVTFAGDPMQRLTEQGINDWRDIEALVESPEIHELRFSYRQSKRLLGIAADLFEKSVGRPAPFEAGFKDGADDPEALRFKRTSSSDEAEWLIQRVGEIYQVCGERLPSIALIVPEEKDVKPLADLLKAPLLELFGIETEDCPQGRILGTQAKVRVFSVQFIKGLEFESVFFVGLDRMAASTPELVDRFLYVGLTRARSFLAVTHAGEFPAELSHVINHFAVGDWKRLIPQ